MKQLRDLFFEAIREANINAIECLIEKGISVNHVKILDHSALVYACEFNNAETIRCLLSHSADIHYKSTSNHRTALHIAVLNKNINSIRVLLEHGADPHALDIFRNSPLGYSKDVDNEIYQFMQNFIDNQKLVDKISCFNETNDGLIF